MTTNSFSFEKGEINITENGEDIILSKPVTVCWSQFLRCSDCFRGVKDPLRNLRLSQVK